MLAEAQKLLKRKQPPKISAPDMLAGIETRNRKILLYDIQKGQMFPMPGGSIQKAVKEKSKKDVRVKAKAGTSYKYIKTKYITNTLQQITNSQ